MQMRKLTQINLKKKKIVIILAVSHISKALWYFALIHQNTMQIFMFSKIVGILD